MSLLLLLLLLQPGIRVPRQLQPRRLLHPLARLHAGRRGGVQGGRQEPLRPLRRLGARQGAGDPGRHAEQAPVARGGSVK